MSLVSTTLKAGWKDANTVEQQLEQNFSQISNQSYKKPLCLIVDGTTLGCIFQVYFCNPKNSFNELRFAKVNYK